MDVGLDLLRFLGEEGDGAVEKGPGGPGGAQAGPEAQQGQMAPEGAGGPWEAILGTSQGGFAGESTGGLRVLGI